MNIELPKDAEGREIPLDTTAVYGADGKVVTISRWVYCNAIGFLKDASSGWYAMDSGDRLVSAASLHLNPPDSWEKLEEDLDRCIAGDNICLYCSPSGRCSDCANEPNGACDAKVLELVMERIKRLRGED